jgi:hypothetical protein
VYLWKQTSNFFNQIIVTFLTGFDDLNKLFSPICYSPFHSPIICNQLLLSRTVSSCLFHLHSENTFRTLSKYIETRCITSVRDTGADWGQSRRLPIILRALHHSYKRDCPFGASITLRFSSLGCTFSFRK